MFAGDAYEACLHGIEPVEAERLDCGVLNRGAFLSEAKAAVAAAAPAAADGNGGSSKGPGRGGEGEGGEGRADGGEEAGAAAQLPTCCGCKAGSEGGACAGGAGWPLLPRTGERLSLTVRRVLKVHRGLRLPGAGSR